MNRGRATPKNRGRQLLRHPAVRLSIGFLAIGLFAASIFSVPAGPAQSRERDRALKLYFTHTGERAEITGMN